MNKSLYIRMMMALTLLFGAMSAASAADRFYLDAANVEPGETKMLAFCLENSQEYFGFQADITLPEGLEVVVSNGKPDITLSSRADASYTIVTNLLTKQSVRLGTFSTSHTPISGDSGALLYIKVKADDDFQGGTLSATGIFFISADDHDVELPDYTVELGTVHNNRFYIPDFKIAVGETKTVSVMLDNETLFTAFQTDIYMPEGLTIVDNSFVMTSRGTAGHTVSAKSFSDGRTRVACLSLANDVFADHSGALLEFQITADKDAAETCTIELKNQLFSMANAKEYIVPNSSTVVTTERALVESILIDADSLNLYVGDSQQLTATPLPTYASTKELLWSSDSPDIASVSQDGLVTAKGIGQAVITAAAVDGSGVTATCAVSVSGIPVNEIKLSHTSASLHVSETLALVATVNPDNAYDKAVNWSSSTPEIASVDSNGVVTALAIGQAIITVRSMSNPEVVAECCITVQTTPVSEIRLNEVSVSMRIGETFDLIADILPETATEKTILWSSENNDIATVSNTGQITAIAPGTTNIIVTAADGSGVTATCAVNVIADEIPEIKMGDVNGDSSITMADIVETINYIMGAPSDSFIKEAADMNGDDSITMADVVAIIALMME